MFIKINNFLQRDVPMQQQMWGKLVTLSSRHSSSTTAGHMLRFQWAASLGMCNWFTVWTEGFVCFIGNYLLKNLIAYLFKNEQVHVYVYESFGRSTGT